MPDYTDLIARLEKATEGSRELDEAIVKALYPDAIISPYCADDDIPVVFHAEPLVPNKRDLPALTTSLDSALTLVPKGHCLTVATRRDLPPEAFVWWADDTESAYSRCATLVLALCAAALKARQAAS